MSDTDSHDRAALRLAARQHGVVTYAQLIELGLSWRAIEHRGATGRLHRVHHGVYAVGRPTLDRRGRQLAAVLAYGPTAVLSHKSAAALWELLVSEQSITDVTVPGTSRRGQKRIRIHRARRLADEDVSILDGIPITSIARTLLDVARGLSRAGLARTVEQGERSGLLDVGAVFRLLDRAGRHPGGSRVAADHGRLPRAGSGSLRARAALSGAGAGGRVLPAARQQPRGRSGSGFLLAPMATGGRAGRAGVSLRRSGFKRDRVRDARLQLARCRVLRVAHKRMTGGPAEVVADARALAALGRAG